MCDTQSGRTFRPAWWLRAAHAQTLWGKLVRRRPKIAARIEVWETPDGDQLEMHRVVSPPSSPRVFVVHGLEGTSRSHYIGGLLATASRRGWGADVMIFRGCGSALNEARRFYHSGETTDLDFALAHVRAEFPAAPLLLVGVSLGGNVVLKWLGEHGDASTAGVSGAVAISAPYDLERGARYISRGFSRVYEAHFLRTLRRKAVRKLRRFPDLFDAAALSRARTIWEFDDVVTAPVHGFRNAHDYYTRSSAIRFLSRIRVPTLLLSAADDPFLPSDVLDAVRTVAAENGCLTVEFHPHGGHVGFVSGVLPWRPSYYAEWRACDFLSGVLAADGLPQPA